MGASDTCKSVLIMNPNIVQHLITTQRCRYKENNGVAESHVEGYNLSTAVGS